MKKRVIFIFLIFFLLSFMVYVFLSYNLTKNSEKSEEVKKITNIYGIDIKADDNFVFLGDSITAQYPLEEFYSGIPVINSGNGGYTTNDVLRTINEELYIYNPSKVFLLIGTNDLINHTPNDQIYDNILKIVKEIKKNRPKAKIYVESIYPTNNSDNEKISQKSVKYRSNEDIDYINKKLEEHFKNTDVTYIDINSKLKDENGLLKLDYTVEGTHITTLGYVRVTNVLFPYLKEQI